MKKYICWLLTLTLSFTCYISAFAQEETNKDFFTLKGLGVVSEEKALQEEMHRGEFSELVAAFLGLSEVSAQLDPSDRYSDVSTSAEYAGAVALLSRLGVLNGKGDGTFAPNESVSTVEAVKVLVYCTGHDMFAKEKGGWPSGYLSVGAAVGFLQGVETKEALTRADAYRLLTNALDVEIWVQGYGEDENAVVRSGDTFRNILMKDRVSGEIFSASGVVEANSYSYIGSPVSNLKDNEVVIDSVVYDVGNTNAAEFFGQKVDFFALETLEEEYILLSVKSVKKQEILTLDAEDFAGKAKNTVYYLSEDGKEQDVPLVDFPKVVYNGTRVLYPKDSLYQLSNGTFTFIDHDGDGVFEVVLLEEYEAVVAKSYSNGLFRFRNDCFYQGKNSLYVDPENDEKKLVLLDADGEVLESFEEDMVLSIFADLDGTRYKIVASNKTIEGILESLSDDEMVVGGTAYAYNKGRNFKEMLGENGTFYLNFDGKIAFSKNNDGSLYGYILGMDRKNNLGALEAKILVAGQVDFGIDINEEDVNDTSRVPYLISQNSAASVFEFAQKVNFEGHTYRDNLDSVSSRLLNRAVKYRLDDDGKINYIKYAEQYGGDENLRSQYNVYEMTFGGHEYLDGFAIDADTKVICVPDNPNQSDDCMVKLKIDVANNSVGYLVTGHDLDESTKKAKLLVIRSGMDSSQVRSVNLMSSRASVVQAVSSKYNKETAETELSVEILTDDTARSLKVSDYLNVSGLKAGDLLAYLTTTNDLLENVLVFDSMSTVKEGRHISQKNNYTGTYGKVINMNSDEVDSLNNVLVTDLTLSANGVEYLFKIPQRNKPSIYLYHKRNKTAEQVPMSEIIPGSDEVYILERTGDSLIRAVVIVR